MTDLGAGRDLGPQPFETVDDCQIGALWHEDLELPLGCLGHDGGVTGRGGIFGRYCWILLGGAIREMGVVRFDKSTADKGRQYVRDRRRSTSGPQTRRGGRGVAVGGGLGGIVIAIVAALFGLGSLGGSGGSAFNIDSTGFDTEAGAISDSGPVDSVDPDADTVQYMEALMFDIQDTWDQYFDEAGLSYEYTTLTIFTDYVETAGCGSASSNTGPFYCPAPDDMGVYVDLAFYDDLKRNFGAPGDFAQAYVIAHEIGHHLQAILGISDEVRRAQSNDPANRNEYSIRQELQADCLAGVWAHSASTRLTRDTGQPILERGDIEEGLDAAASVGDDKIQAQAGMTIDPHTWTHGSAEQRVRWFTIGFDTGDPEQCDTFAASEV